MYSLADSYVPTAPSGYRPDFSIQVKVLHRFGEGVYVPTAPSGCLLLIFRLQCFTPFPSNMSLGKVRKRLE